MLQYGAIYLAAYQGNAARLSALIDSTVSQASAGGQGNAVVYASPAQAIVLNGRGRHREGAGASPGCQR